ncbi:MAG: hypothetical protein WCI01_03675 [Chlorobiaceae bacterium]
MDKNVHHKKGSNGHASDYSKQKIHKSLVSIACVHRPVRPNLLQACRTGRKAGSYKQTSAWQIQLVFYLYRIYGDKTPYAKQIVGVVRLILRAEFFILRSERECNQKGSISGKWQKK